MELDRSNFHFATPVMIKLLVPGARAITVLPNMHESANRGAAHCLKGYGALWIRGVTLGTNSHPNWTEASGRMAVTYTVCSRTRKTSVLSNPHVCSSQPFSYFPLVETN